VSIPSASPCRQQVLVLDPGLKDSRTHHHVINRHLAAYARELATGIRVVSHRRASAAEFPYPVTPAFRRGVYEDSPALDAAAFAALVDDHVRDLAHILATPAPTAVVVHTATAAFLQALGATLAAGDHHVGSAVIQLMFHPLGLAVGEADPEASMARYADAFRLLRHAERQCGTSVHLSTSCREFAQAFEGLGAGVVDVHPYALLAEAERMEWLQRRPTTRAAAGSGRGRALLFGGDLKLDKGIAWVAAALPVLLAEHPDVDFFVHLGDNRFADPRLDLLRRQVVEMAARCPHLRVVEGHIAPPDWDGMIASADFVLIPYDPSAYRWKTSGIFWEALFKGRPGAVIAVTKGTWMEREAGATALDVTAVEFGNTAELSAVLRRGAGGADGSGMKRLPQPWLARGNDDYIFARLGGLG
jgi:hypothetical protein